MLEMGTERDKHTMGVINRRSKAKTKDQSHNIFKRPARLRKLSQEFVAEPLRWPDPAGSLADDPSNKILGQVKILETKSYPSCEMETYRGDMRCHFDNRFGDQMYDNIRTWPIRVAQDKFVLGVIKALDVGSVQDLSTE